MRLSAFALLLVAGARAASAESFVYEVVPAPGGAVRVAERFDRAEARPDLPLLTDPAVALRRWVESSATAVAGYYGRLPVSKVTVTLNVVRRGRISGGVTHGGRRGARIDVNVGPALTQADLSDDWVLTHEFVHTAAPRLPEEATWLDEGLATYVEPIARARSGAMSVERVWIWLAKGLPEGLPKAGDEGLDVTHTWGRTYWGGALFCLLADIELREKTQNRLSLRDALIGALDAGGDVNASWRIEIFLAAADRATGLTVLTDLHARMGPRPMDTDLPALWKRLGVAVREGRVSYDGSAPLAPLAKAIPTGARAAEESKIKG